MDAGGGLSKGSTGWLPPHAPSRGRGSQAELCSHGSSLPKNTWTRPPKTPDFAHITPALSSSRADHKLFKMVTYAIVSVSLLQPGFCRRSTEAISPVVCVTPIVLRATLGAQSPRSRLAGSPTPGGPFLSRLRSPVVTGDLAPCHLGAQGSRLPHLSAPQTKNHKDRKYPVALQPDAGPQARG